MESIAPTHAAPGPPPPALDQRPETGQGATQTARRIADYAAALERDLVPGILQVQLDERAQRFVQTWTDPVTDEVVRRYPSEAQLAYSRAVMAYLRAQAVA